MTARLLAALPAAAVCLAEGAWIGVVAALWAAVAVGSVPTASVWLLSALVAVGLVSARWLRRRDVRREALVVGALAVLSGLLVGALLWPTAPAAAVGSGSLAALAVWRGSRHRDPGADDVVTSNMLRIGLPSLAIPWLIGAAAAGSRDVFIAAALPATLLFVAASLMAVGLTRLEALSAESGLDWASNRAWLFLLGGIVFGLALVSVPATLVLGAPLGEVVRGLLAPVATAADLAGSAIAAGLAASGIAPPPGVGQVPPPIPGGAPGMSLPSWAGVALSLLGLAVLIGAAVYAASRVRGTPADASTAVRVREEHHVDLRSLRVSLPPLPRPWRGLVRRRLLSVTDAYLAALDHLASRDLGRAGGESPRAHAHRVRDAVGWRLGFLAADYELERYGRSPVTPSERRRALTRTRWLRRR